MAYINARDVTDTMSDHDLVSWFPSPPRVVPAALICQHGSPEGAMAAYGAFAAAIGAASEEQTSKGGERPKEQRSSERAFCRMKQHGATEIRIDK